MSEQYSPDAAPDPQAWLARTEDARLSDVVAYHQAQALPMANVRLHAAIHVVVENQLALGEPLVVDTFARLQREGLTRHEAIHAVGSVLTQSLLSAIRTKTTSPYGLAGGYLEDLKRLTADGWKSEN
jgi:hypothetical protein